MTLRPITIRQLAGLHTDVSPFDAPEGALRQAEHVMMHRPGLIVPRFGIGDTTGVGSRTTDYRPIQFIPWRGEVTVQSRDGSNYRIERLSVNTQQGALAPHTTDGFGRSSWTVARQSLYLAGTAGVRKIESPSASAHEPAGVATDYHTFTAFSRTGTEDATNDRVAIDPDSSVAYRYCWTRRDVNGYIRRSAPSPRMVGRNTDATDGVFATISRLYLPTGIGAGDFLELYRTVNSGDAEADPGDECYLVGAFEITSTQAGVGYIDVGDVWDVRADEELGQALYTNASQGGILTANEVPPTARCLATWRDVTWFGNVNERLTLLVEPLAVFDDTRVEWDLDGLHFSTKTCGVTTGSATITVDSPRGLKVGQYVTDNTLPIPNAGSVVEGDRTYIPQGAQITAIVTKLTIDNHANITTVGSPDEINITNLTNLVGNFPGVKWDATITGAFLAAVGADAGEAADNFATALSAGGELWGVGPITATSDSVDTVDIVSDEGHGIPLAITETNVGTFSVVYEVTIDTNAKATSGSTALDFHDYIEVNGVEMYPSTAGATISHLEQALGSSHIDWRAFNCDFSAIGSTTGLDQAKVAAAGLADAINAQAIRAGRFPIRAYYDDVAPIRPSYGNDLNLSAPGPTAIVLIAEDPSVSSVTFNSPVRPNAFRVSSSGSVSAVAGEHKNRIFFSKPGEPEAVPSVSYFDVGAPDRRILALVPLENALLVFKEDGIWSVTGAAPSSWVVSEIDGSKRLLAPACVTVLDNIAYAWTDRGLFQVTEAGVAPQPISAPIDYDLRAFQTLLPSGSGVHAQAFQVEAHPRLGLVILSVSGTATSLGTFAHYVWAKSTQRWSRWTREDYTMAYDPDEDRMLVGVRDEADGVWRCAYERDGETSASTFHDFELSSVSASTEDGIVVKITKADFGGLVPAACDVIDLYTSGEASIGAYRVASVADTGSEYELTLDGAYTGALVLDFVNWYQAIPSELTWQPVRWGPMGGRWSEVQATFGAVSSAYLTTVPVTIGAAAHRDSSVSTVDGATITAPVTYSDVVRAGAAKGFMRTPHLYPYLKVCTAGVRWELAHIDVFGEAESHRRDR